MKMQDTFVAERVLAQHCAELTERGPSASQREEALAVWRRMAVRAIEDQLAGLFLGERLGVRLGEVEKMAGAAVFERIGPVAANCQLQCGSSQAKALFSAGYASVVALTDRSFGGTGEGSDEQPERLSRSSVILVDSLARIVAGGLAASCEDEGVELVGEVIVRSESASRVSPFSAGEKCVVFEMTLEAPGQGGWPVLLALTQSQFDKLLFADGVAVIDQRLDTTGPADPRSRPFSQIPLVIEADLARFQLPLSKLEAIRPGEEIALAIPRHVPLRIGKHAFARGTIGALKEQFAIKLTSLSEEGLYP